MALQITNFSSHFCHKCSAQVEHEVLDNGICSFAMNAFGMCVQFIEVHLSPFAIGRVCLPVCFKIDPSHYATKFFCGVSLCGKRVALSLVLKAGRSHVVMWDS